MAQTRFRLGNHEFLLPSETGPLSRLQQKRRSPIEGASPPRFLTGCGREPATSASAKELLKGKFCGHGEPTYTVFDIVCNGRDALEVAAFMPEEDSETEDPKVLLARPAGTGGAWLVVFDAEWADEFGDMRLPEEPVWRTLDAEEEAEAAEAAVAATLSIGFEYPCDAESVDQVSWLTIDGWPEGHKGTPVVLVDRECA